MSANFVNVVINATDVTGANLQTGSVHLQVNDLVWVQSVNQVIVVDPIDIAANGGEAGTVTVPLLAMDNAGYSANWAWVVSGLYRGVTFPPRKLVVNFANGPQQNFADLLAASTLA